MKASKLGALAVIVAAAVSSVGCAIHVQGPVREVARDFSDHDFYDRSYAPSPNYQPLVGRVTVVSGARAAAVTSPVGEEAEGSRLVPLPNDSVLMTVHAASDDAVAAGE